MIPTELPLYNDGFLQSDPERCWSYDPALFLAAIVEWFKLPASWDRRSTSPDRRNS